MAKNLDIKSVTKKMNTSNSITRARKSVSASSWSIKLSKKVYTWSENTERIKLIRERLPYESIEVLSKKANLSIKQLLLLLGLPQTTYNKDKFQNWLAKTNLSLGGVAPKSLFDSLTGIQEVKNCLNRLEHGNLA